MPEQSTILDEGSVAVVPQKAEKKSGKRIGFNYIILKSLKESKKNDVVKCIYIKGITNFGVCVIKEGSQGDTKDEAGRDIQDRLKWQRTLHERLAGKVRVPKYIDSFEENGNYYLVIERIKGESFYQIIRKNRNMRQSLLEGGTIGLRMVDYLEQAVGLLNELHKHRIIHRDVTLANFMATPGGKVALIDLELSYSLDERFPQPPFALGTHGYMSPEQEVISTPTAKQDVFSMGAVMLHIYTGISPLKLIKIPGDDFRRAVNFFVEDEAIANLIARCTMRDADLRPDTGEVLQSLREYRKALNNKKQMSVAKKELYTNQEVEETIRMGVAALGESVLRDREKGWFAEHLTEKKESSSEIRKTWYASFNRGVSGILYFLSRAYVTGYDVSPAEEPIQQAFDLIRMKYLSNKIEPVKSGYYFGSDGIAMCLSEIYRNGWMDAEKTMMADWAYLLSGTAKEMDLCDGWAGQGIANLHCAAMLPATREKYFADELMGRQLPEGNWQLPERRRAMHIEYGQSGVIYFLLRYGMITKEAEAVKRAIKGVQFLMDNAIKTGDAVSWRKNKRTANSKWCEGNPGISLIFLRAYEATGDVVYRDWAEMALTGHNESRLWASLSLCHGIAGLGETYLEAAHILRDEKWMEKAANCAQILLHMRQRTKQGNAFWYVERERQPVANLFVGNTGVLHFLLRYLHQGKLGFPGMI